MLINLEKIVEVPDYYIDDESYEIWSYRRKTPMKMKLILDRSGYLRFNVFYEGKRKHIWYHQLIVKLFIDCEYDSKTHDIDHLDHNKQNNSLENLRVVSKSQNHLNRSVYGGKQAVYLDNIGESIPVNVEHGVYYSKTFDKFYRLVEHTGKYRQLTETKIAAHMQIDYKYNKKSHHINCTKFREQLSFL